MDAPACIIDKQLRKDSLSPRSRSDFSCPGAHPDDQATVTRASRRNRRPASLINMLLCPHPPHPFLITPSELCLISAVFWRLLKSDQQIREHLLGHCGSRRVSDAAEKLLSASESVGRNLRLGAAASFFCFWSSERLPQTAGYLPRLAQPLRARPPPNVLHGSSWTRSRHFLFIVVSKHRQKKTEGEFGPGWSEEAKLACLFFSLLLAVRIYSGVKR